MERRIMVALLKACGAALLAFGFLVCSNPIDIVGSVATEVKVANNKFLLVKASGPFAANDQNVSPGTTIWVQFDRDLDTSTLSAQSVVFAPSKGWTWNYNSAVRTLTVTPSALDSLTQYTVTIGEGLIGIDGSKMQAMFVFAFKTKLGPSGTMAINSGSGYTNNTAVTLSFTTNIIASKVRFSTNEADITTDPMGGNVLLAGQGIWNLRREIPGGGADGSKTIYYQLTDSSYVNSTSSYDASGSHPLSASIVYDTASPTPNSFSINKGAMISSGTIVTLYSDVTDTLSPIEMHFQNAGGSWSAWANYSSVRGKWFLSSPGTRLVTAEFRDKRCQISLLNLMTRS